MKAQKDHYAVILAGGSGTRFWPLSRQQRPKQFLNIVDSQTLFQKTVERVRPLIPPDRIYIVTGSGYKKMIRQQCRSYNIPGENILLEPSGKNTAPAILWAAATLFRRNPHSVMAVLPADHLILKPQAFRKHLKEAFRLADRQYLVTMGIVPHRPETGYGYMKCRKDSRSRPVLWPVDKFVEKPDLPKARRYLKEKKYFWNSGIFIWRTDNILTEYSVHLPEAYHLLFNKSNRQVLKSWSALPNISVDYAILEKADRVVCIPAADMEWSDLGSWEALFDVLPKDKNGNHSSGNILQLDCRNTFVRSETCQVAAIGLENIAVVVTGDAVLVCRTQDSQKVRTVVDILKKKNRKIV